MCCSPEKIHSRPLSSGYRCWNFSNIIFFPECIDKLQKLSNYSNSAFLSIEFRILFIKDTFSITLEEFIWKNIIFWTEKFFEHLIQLKIDDSFKGSEEKRKGFYFRVSLKIARSVFFWIHVGACQLSVRRGSFWVKDQTSVQSAVPDTSPSRNLWWRIFHVNGMKCKDKEWIHVASIWNLSCIFIKNCDFFSTVSTGILSDSCYPIINVILGEYDSRKLCILFRMQTMSWIIFFFQWNK